MNLGQNQFSLTRVASKSKFLSVQFSSARPHARVIPLIVAVLLAFAARQPCHAGDAARSGGADKKALAESLSPGPNPLEQAMAAKPFVNPLEQAAGHRARNPLEQVVLGKTKARGEKPMEKAVRLAREEKARQEAESQVGDGGGSWAEHEAGPESINWGPLSQPIQVYHDGSVKQPTRPTLTEQVMKQNQLLQQMILEHQRAYENYKARSDYQRAVADSMIHHQPLPPLPRVR